MSGARHRRKGLCCEREIVRWHVDAGIHAERYPLSGASRFRDSGHDVDVYAFGRDAAPLVAEIKARKDGAGFAQLERWLGEYDLLFLRRNNADPMVLLPWRTWAALRARKAMTRPDTIANDELNWHGWPPQVWDGRKWRYIEPARVLAQQAQELRRLHRLLIIARGRYQAINRRDRSEGAAPNQVKTTS